jgi:DNA-binding CsgD family transcriptional regulator
MTRRAIQSPPAPLLVDRQKLNAVQADILSSARRWAANEVFAAIAHQFNEPVTALLFYLHEIKQEGEHFSDTETARKSIREMVENALRETERVCDILERIANKFNSPVASETAVASGREVIAWWARSSRPNGSDESFSVYPLRERLLTPREREVLELIAGGASNKEGGHRLGISTRTFEAHRSNIMKKLGARNAADLVRMALRKSG